jgi:hypothetical protein
MQEFTTVSSSSYDPSALAVKLNEKSAEGWSVVSIVSTGGDVTAFLSRDTAGAPAAEPESVAPLATSTVEDKMASFEPMVPESPTATEPVRTAPAAEPSGWAVAPEPAAPQPSTPSVEPSPSPSYTPAASSATTTYTPAAAPAATPTPSVPAGWYADPAGRFELRYWDGGTWTEHVSRAGQQYTDPPVA